MGNWIIFQTHRILRCLDFMERILRAGLSRGFILDYYVDLYRKQWIDTGLSLKGVTGLSLKRIKRKSWYWIITETDLAMRRNEWITEYRQGIGAEWQRTAKL